MSSNHENAHLKVFLLNEEVSIDEVEKCLVENYLYSPINIQNIDKGFTLFAWIRNSPETYPDWKDIVAPYLDQVDNSKIGTKKRCDLVLMAIRENQVDSTKNRTFIIPGGMGSVHLQQYLDSQFGIQILSRIFDESENTITNLDEKSVIGDILASIRFYRHPRILSQEDSFGKIYNRLSIGVTEPQLKQFFPTFISYLDSSRKQRPSLVIDGSSSLDLKSKITLPVLLNTLKDIDTLLDSNEKTEFNRTLIPLTKRKNPNLIAKLENELRKTIIDGCINDKELDLNICPIDFSNFYKSLFFEFGNAESNREPLELLCNLSALKEHFLFEQRKNPSVDMISIYNSLTISTFDDEHVSPLTSGKIQAYVNTEIRLGNTSYFILDNAWYELQAKFDTDLSQKYKERILDQSHVSDYPLAPIWRKAMTEDSYLNWFIQSNPNSTIIKVHPLKTSTNLELCDLIHINGDVTELIFTKVGIGATTRDLVSQVSMAVNILSIETRTTAKPEIEKLFDTLSRNRRIPSNISKGLFLSYFCRPMSQFIFVLLFHDKKSEVKLKYCVPPSRIATVSLIEFDSYKKQLGFNYLLVAR